MDVSVCVKRFARACVCVSLPLWECDFVLCVCVCTPSSTHTHTPLYERHITLAMTLLDGDGPFNYAALMQSAVNTLNQAAEEEAAYPSSPPPAPSPFPCSCSCPLPSTPLPSHHFSWSRSRPLYICFLLHSLVLLSATTLHPSPPPCRLYLEAPRAGAPPCVDSKTQAPISPRPQVSGRTCLGGWVCGGGGLSGWRWGVTGSAKRCDE